MTKSEQIHDLEIKLIRLNSKYVRLLAVASEHAGECDAAGSLRTILRQLDTEGI